MPTAQRTSAGEALRTMLPAGTNPYSMIELACRTAFMARDREILPSVLDVVMTDPQFAASLIVALAALVDVDRRPDAMLAWLGTDEGREQDTARQIAALAEARNEYNDAATDALPPVTLESMRAMAHAARIAGVMQPCGTLAAHSRHLRKKQKPCPRCSWARWLYDAATPEERLLIKTPLAVGDRAATLRARCGTVAGYDSHEEHGERPCEACHKAAVEVVTVKQPLSVPPVKRRSCGKRSGYVAHRAQQPKEIPCDPCAEAQRQYDAGRRAEKMSCSKPLQEVGATLQDHPAATVHPISPPGQWQVDAA